ncbi:hypothetical protein D3C81_1593790 [compost metagenome]
MFQHLEVDLDLLLWDVGANQAHSTCHQSSKQLGVDFFKIPSLTERSEHPLERLRRDALNANIAVRSNRQNLVTRRIGIFVLILIPFKDVNVRDKLILLSSNHAVNVG